MGQHTTAQVTVGFLLGAGGALGWWGWGDLGGALDWVKSHPWSQLAMYGLAGLSFARFFVKVAASKARKRAALRQKAAQ